MTETVMLTFPSLVPGQPDNPMVEKEIGPEGGVVELENVARLEIPAGALNQPTLIKIYQILQVESTQKWFGKSMHVPEGEWLPGYDFITPVVRLEPFLLELNVAATLYLPTDAARVGINDPRLIYSRASDTARPSSWVFSPYLEPFKKPGAPFVAKIDNPIMVKKLAYVVKWFPSHIRPQQGAAVSYGRVEFYPGIQS